MLFICPHCLLSSTSEAERSGSHESRVCFPMMDIQEWRAVTHVYNPQQVSQDTLSSLEFYWASWRVTKPSGMCLRHNVQPFYFERKRSLWSGSTTCLGSMRASPCWGYSLAPLKPSLIPISLRSCLICWKFPPQALNTLSWVCQAFPTLSQHASGYPHHIVNEINSTELKKRKRELKTYWEDNISAPLWNFIIEGI